MLIWVIVSCGFTVVVTVTMVFVTVTGICGVVTDSSDGAELIHPENTTASIIRRVAITAFMGSFKIHHRIILKY